MWCKWSQNGFFDIGLWKNSFKVQRQRARSEMRDDIYANCAGLMKYSLHSLPIFLSLSIDPSLSLSHSQCMSPTIQTKKNFIFGKKRQTLNWMLSMMVQIKRKLKINLWLNIYENVFVVSLLSVIENFVERVQEWVNFFGMNEFITFQALLPLNHVR